MLFKKNNSNEFLKKLTQLEQLLMTLENREIKFNIVYTFNDDLIINICDKSTKKESKKELEKQKEKNAD